MKPWPEMDMMESKDMGLQHSPLLSFSSFYPPGRCDCGTKSG